MISKSIKIVIEAKWRNCFFLVQKKKKIKVPEDSSFNIYMEGHTYWLCLMG